MRRVCFLFTVVVLLSGCYGTPALLKLPLVEEGSVFLYVQPFPAEAGQVRFHMSEVIARRDDGSEFPLTPVITEYSVDTIKRQRLAASGIMPPGQYTGLAFRASDAFLKGEAGENSLLVPENPVFVPFPFEVQKGKSFLIEGTLRPEEAARERFSFSPSFALVHPKLPITALMGYVSNSRSNNITVFNKKSGQVVDVIETGAGPQGIALDQLQRKAYVALADEDSIDIIDVTRDEIIHRIALSAGDHPQQPALTPGGRLLITANRGSDTVSIIDPLTFLELQRIAVGRGPNAVLVDSSGKRAYVFNTLSDSISIVDITAGMVTATISTDAGPLWGQLNRKEDSLFVIHSFSPYLSVFDTSNLSLRQRIHVGSGASFLKVDATTDRIYLARRNDPLMQVYTPGLDIPVDRATVGGGISGMAIDGDENYLYCVIPQNNILKSISLIGYQEVMEFDVGEGAYWVTLMGER